MSLFCPVKCSAPLSSSGGGTGYLLQRRYCAIDGRPLLFKLRNDILYVVHSVSFFLRELTALIIDMPESDGWIDFCRAARWNVTSDQSDQEQTGCPDRKGRLIRCCYFKQQRGHQP